MDSQDSSVNHHHQHLHYPQPQLPSHHAASLMAQNQLQHRPFNIPYPLSNSNNSAPTPISSVSMMHQENPRFPFNSVAPPPKPLDQQYSDGSPSGSGGGLFNTEPARKKRGRPRKYSPDNSIGLGLSPAPVAQISSAGYVDSGGTPSADTPAKRNRGRPPGSGKKQLDALGVPGVGFTPHVITVESGEDISSKIQAFSQQGPRTICILSANGAICNVTLRQPAMSTNTVTYEGRFEIISLSGSFFMSESNGESGGLSVSLAGADGKVMGGGVAGVLKAASPVQVVVGSFIAEGKKSKTVPSSSNMPTFEAPVGSPSDSSEDNDGGRPVEMHPNMGWPNSMKINPS